MGGDHSPHPSHRQAGEQQSAATTQKKLLSLKAEQWEEVLNLHVLYLVASPPLAGKVQAKLLLRRHHLSGVALAPTPAGSQGGEGGNRTEDGRAGGICPG